ncbi:MAG TPA: glycosyltransferase [Chitinophagaceae bacterium]|nr:glycosyltransferase [Chitinophagaceae bacterium]HMZ46587.1 glycosyltransferase [Chitinophagaceae bacterium]
MNIAIIGKFYTEGFGLHIEETLSDMGHTIVRIDPEMEFLQYNFLGKRIKNINKTLYQQVFHKIPAIRNFKSKDIYNSYKANKIDFTIVTHDFLTKQEIDTIKKINPSPIVLWFPDAISNFQKSMFFVAGYDYLFFVDKYIVEVLKSEFNFNIHYLPQCCNPKKHNRVVLNEQDINFYSCDITNAGNLYPSRSALYKHLLNYNIKMWGAPPSIWLKLPELDKIIMNKSVHNQEKSKAFMAAKIVLNNLHPAVINGVNKRTFEIPACGGLQFTSYRAALNELFEVGKEVVAYKDLEDLKNKIDYFINPQNEAERLQIIEAGYKRAITEHTYEQRLNQLLDTVFN